MIVVVFLITTTTTNLVMEERSNAAMSTVVAPSLPLRLLVATSPAPGFHLFRPPIALAVLWLFRRPEGDAFRR